MPHADRISWRSLLLIGFVAGLHGLVLNAFWSGSDGRIAGELVILSVLPLTMGAAYLLGRLLFPMTWLDISVLAYSAWCIASIVLYLQPANPSRTGAYIYGVYNLVLPIACYFAAKSVPRRDHTYLVTALVLLNGFAIGYGLFLYFTRPAYYVAYLSSRLAQTGAVEEWQLFGRLQSYLGSTAVGYIGATSLVLITVASRQLRRLIPALAVLFIVGAALSLQRASFVGLALALIYLIFLSPQRIRFRLLTLVTFTAALIYAVASFATKADPLANTVEARATTDMIEGVRGFTQQRGYMKGLSYLSEFPIGVGIGGTSSAAESAGLLREGEVADANFMRIAADLGVPGLALFLLIVGIVLWRAWQSQHRAAWLVFLAIHFGIMLSTNVLDSFYISHGFWLVIGVIDADRKDLPVRSTIRSWQHLAGSPASVVG